MENLEGKIESYILDELTGEELAAFENMLKTDVSLVQAVADHRTMMARLEALRLRNKVADSLAQSSTDPVADSSNRYKTLLIAGVVLGGLTALIWLINQYETPVNLKQENSPAQPVQQQSTDQGGANEKMAEQNPSDAKPGESSIPTGAENRMRLLALAREFHQPPAPAQIRDAAGATDPAANKKVEVMATEAFEAGNYSLVIAMLQPEDLVSQDENMRNLRANARFKAGQYLLAASDFEKLQNSFRFKHDARWNFMLCQLAQAKMEQVQPLLSAMVADKDYPYHDKAVQLSRKL